MPQSPHTISAARTDAEPALHPVHLPRTGQQLSNNIWLAPMAGTSDLTYRRICRRCGAGLTVTELVSARGIRYSGVEGANFRYLVIDPAEKPVWIQLFGFDPADFRSACEQIAAHPLLRQCSGIDINMGCPVKKVIQTGAGSALMRTPDTAAAIVRTVRETAEAAGTGWSVSVKIRKGFAAGDCAAPAFAVAMAEAGADLITVHGRTADQLYSGTADWRCIAETRAALRAAGYTLPLIANGDVTDAASARAILRATGADGLMIGRAAQGNPWIFRTVTGALAGPAGAGSGAARAQKSAPADAVRPPADTPAGSTAGAAARPEADEVKSVILEHLDGLIGQRGETVAVREMRAQLAAYFKHTYGAAAFRRQIGQVSTRSDVCRLVDAWAADQRAPAPAGLPSDL